MANIWRSQRLIYRAVDTEDEAFLSTISADSEAYLNSTPFLPIPQGKKSALAFREYLTDRCMLAVIVCLPAPAPGAVGSDEAASSQIPIGQICLAAEDGRQLHHRRSRIGVSITRPYQGQGYGSEAITWVLEWGFKHANLHRIEIGAFAWNAGALKLYEKLGFAPESRKRDFLWHDGGYSDLVELSMLEHEWKERYGTSSPPVR